MKIKDWPATERPREKLLMRGASALTDAELIAIFLRTGTANKNALDIARDLLNQHGCLRNLFNASQFECCQTQGLGPAKFAQLQAILEIGKRYLQEQLEHGEIISHSDVTKKFLTSHLRDYKQEVFACLFMSAQNRVISFDKMFYGSLTEANIHPREIVKSALKHNAAKVILTHNHPSGDCTPSQSDIDITQVIHQALALIDVAVIDHIVVGSEHCTSFAEHGLL